MCVVCMSTSVELCWFVGPDFASSVQPSSVWADSFFGAQTRGMSTSTGGLILQIQHFIHRCRRVNIANMHVHRYRKVNITNTTCVHEG